MKKLALALMTLWLGVAPAANLETIPAGENAAIAKIRDGIAGSVKHQFATAGPVATRDAHAKAHGCVRAELRVNDTLPVNLRSQVFQPGAVYPTWVRLSNGSGRSADDTIPDGRGLALKVMGVQGTKLATDEKFTQDFLFINHPAFFVRNVEDYVAFIAAGAKGDPSKFFFPTPDKSTWRAHEAEVAEATRSHKMSDPLGAQYFTMTPYLFGDRAAKFTVRPCTPNDEVVASTKTPNLLRENMAAHLTQRAGCFELAVQFQKDAKTMPVEDPTITWEESQSPFVKLATLTIPKQTFTSDKQQAFCENLSLNPWHSVEEHRPLGGVNRTRRVVYETISKLRHDLNREPLIEPTGNETF